MPSFDKEKFITWVKTQVNYEALSYKATEAFTGWDAKDPQIYFTKTRAVLEVAEDVVDLLEKFCKEVDYLSGKQKLEGAVDFLDDLIKFNFILELVDGIAIKMLLSAIVQQKNKWFGENWFKINE